MSLRGAKSEPSKKNKQFLYPLDKRQKERKKPSQKEKEKDNKDIQNHTKVIETLGEVLEDPILRNGYLQFLKQAYCEESIYCFFDILFFEKEFLSMSGEGRISAAQAIIDMYIRIGSTNEINIGDTLRLPVIELVTKATENLNLTPRTRLPSDCFTTIREELYRLMKGDTFIKYKQSPLFSRAQQHLVNLSPEKGRGDKFKEDQITPEEWNILMVGAIEKHVEKGEVILTQGESNTFFFRLESGCLRVEKSSGEKKSDPGTVFGEISMMNHLPASATIVAETPSVIKKLQANLLLYLFLSTNTEPHVLDLGRRFFLKLGRTLSTLLVEVTSLDHTIKIRNTFANRIKRFDATPVSEKKSATPAEKFSKRFGFSEPVIEHYECSLEKNGKYKKGLLYISSKHICFYYTSFGHKIKEVCSFEKLSINPNASSKPNSLVVNTSEKDLIFIFETEEIRNHCESILITISTSIQSEENQNQNHVTLKMSGETPQEIEKRLKTELTDEEWDILEQNQDSLKCHLFFTRGDKVIDEGFKAKKVFRIRKGRCRVEKFVPNRQINEPLSIIIDYLEEGAVFGQISLFNDREYSASIIADSFCELTVINATEAFLYNTFQTHPLILLKFYYLCCSDLASLIIKREAQGWRRFKCFLDDSNCGLTGTKKENTFQVVRRNRKNNNNSEREYTIEYLKKDVQQFISGKLRIDEGMVFFYLDSPDDPILLLDLLEHLYLPIDNESFSLVNNFNIFHTFRSTSENISFIAQHIKEESITIQSKFITNAPISLVLYVKNNFNKTLKVSTVKMKTEENGNTWITVTAILKNEYISFFRPGTRKYALAKSNIVFGTLQILSGPSFRIISDAIVEVLCDTIPERDAWLVAANNVRNKLYEEGLKQCIAERVKFFALRE